MYVNCNFHTKDLSKHTFLVTGGAGFIGSNIVEYLLQHNAKKVVVLDNLSTGFKKNIEPFLSKSNFEFIEGSICDYCICIDAMKDVDYVFHQAALGSVPRSVKDPWATNDANVTGFMNVLCAAKEAGIKRIVYASSSSVYGDNPDSPKQEENIGNALSPYAVSKRVNELYADIFSRTYGMEIIGLRYFNIFGQRQNPEGEYAAVIPLFIDGLLNNKPIYINGDGMQSRDFTYIENAVQANIKAMFAPKGASNEVYNIGCGETTSVNDLFKMLRTIIGSKAYPTHREQRKGDIKDSMAEIYKAKKILRYQPQVAIEEGLKHTVEWFRNY